jgi:integrase
LRLHYQIDYDASLPPRRFQFEVAQPTVTIEAKSSKRRKADVLPLHPDLVPYLRKWTQGLRASESLFPKLDSRKTWLMVRKDLERAGLEYRTDDGIADFHAAGRHSHITELLRSGATVPQAMELARHSYVRMTVRYTHVSIAEQARALSVMAFSCQDIVRKSA